METTFSPKLVEGIAQIFNFYTNVEGAGLGKRHAKGVCEYRVGGKSDCLQRCPVGVLIPNEKYSTNIEAGLSIYDKNPPAIILRELGYKDSDLRHLVELQSIHDSDIVETKEDFLFQLREYCTEWDIPIPEAYV